MRLSWWCPRLHEPGHFTTRGAARPLAPRSARPGSAAASRCRRTVRSFVHSACSRVRLSRVPPAQQDRRPRPRATTAHAHSTAKPVHGASGKQPLYGMSCRYLRVLQDALLHGERGGGGEPQQPLRRPAAAGRRQDQRDDDQHDDGGDAAGAAAQDGAGRQGQDRGDREQRRGADDDCAPRSAGERPDRMTRAVQPQGCSFARRTGTRRRRRSGRRRTSPSRSRWPWRPAPGPAAGWRPGGADQAAPVLAGDEQRAEGDHRDQARASVPLKHVPQRVRRRHERRDVAGPGHGERAAGLLEAGCGCCGGFTWPGRRVGLPGDCGGPLPGRPGRRSRAWAAARPGRRWSKTAVACVGAPASRSLPPKLCDRRAVAGRGHEQPGLHGRRQPGQVGRADLVQCAPSAES